MVKSLTKQQQVLQYRHKQSSMLTSTVGTTRHLRHTCDASQEAVLSPLTVRSCEILRMRNQIKHFHITSSVAGVSAAFCSETACQILTIEYFDIKPDGVRSWERFPHYCFFGRGINRLTVHSWWRHQWKHFRVTGPLWGEFTGHRYISLTKASDAELWCFFYLCLNKRLSKQSRHRWFETSWCPLWHHCNAY